MVPLGTAVTYQRSLVEQVAVVSPGSKVRTDAIAQMAVAAGFITQGTTVTAKLFVLTVSEQRTFVFGFIKRIMRIQGAMFFDFFGNGRRIFSDLLGDFAERESCIQSFFDSDSVILGHVFVITGYSF